MYAFQSTPSAWRETKCQQKHQIHLAFQSTPSAWRETPGTPCKVVSNFAFQSTPSAWRETMFSGSCTQSATISIHSLRMEGDVISKLLPPEVAHFNPLPPHGGRLSVSLVSNDCFCISIHSLRMEGDVLQVVGQSTGHHFNPLPPHGGRQIPTKRSGPLVGISIHSLRMEGDGGN